MDRRVLPFRRKRVDIELLSRNPIIQPRTKPWHQPRLDAA